MCALQSKCRKFIKYLEFFDPFLLFCENPAHTALLSESPNTPVCVKRQTINFLHIHTTCLSLSERIHEFSILFRSIRYFCRSKSLTYGFGLHSPNALTSHILLSLSLFFFRLTVSLSLTQCLYVRACVCVFEFVYLPVCLCQFDLAVNWKKEHFVQFSFYFV